MLLLLFVVVCLLLFVVCLLFRVVWVWTPPSAGPPFGAPTLRGPTLRRPTLPSPQKTEPPIWAKVGMAKVGQLELAKVGQIRRPKSVKVSLAKVGLAKVSLAKVGLARVSGVSLAQARHKKERTYPELVSPRSRARLVVLAGEVGGRWSEETRVFLRLLARAKARSEPVILRQRVEQAWRMRWPAILACSAARGVCCVPP